MRTLRRSSDAARTWTPWRGPAVPVVVVAALLCLGIANISARATSRGVEGGVLWKAQPEGVIAADVAPGTGASAADIRRGDVLIAIDGRPGGQGGGGGGGARGR